LGPVCSKYLQTLQLKVTQYPQATALNRSHHIIYTTDWSVVLIQKFEKERPIKHISYVARKVPESV
jgi:hypothetical protein